ncbi:MAG: ABC transporter permease subunit [Pleurocapsa minor GSE-CHR-MK-17-07R]|jgi:putative spermidine/putrescine transport system permease protein|nr:ABC transporter permease subunit [Pleurocapsa minor GSE-CHR-MK 17-07R]
MTTLQPASPVVPGFWAGTAASFRAMIRRNGFGLLALIVLILVILGPLYSVVLWAFAERWQYPSLIPQEFGFTFWERTFARADIAEALPFSIILSLVVTLLSAVICLPASYAFARMKFRGRQLLLLSFLATNAFPRFGLYISIAVIFFRLNLIGTVQGVILIQLVNTLLLMIWIPTAAFQGVDKALEEAALDVGASRLRVFMQITLPMVMPALSAALLLTFVNTFYEAQGALLIGLPRVVTMPVLMYSLINSQLIVQYGAIVSLVLWLPSLLLLIVAQRLLRGGYLTAGFGV